MNSSRITVAKSVAAHTVTKLNSSRITVARSVAAHTVTKRE
jgi:hypothetical protein